MRETSPDPFGAAQYRQQGLKTRHLQSQGVKSSVKRTRVTTSFGGKKLWETKCVSCHFINGDGFDAEDKRGLRRFILNRKTGYPFNPEQILPELQYAVSGRTSSMPSVDINDKELTLLVNYLISTFK